MLTRLALPLLLLGGCAPLDPYIQALPEPLAREPAWRPDPEPRLGEGFERHDLSFPCGETWCAAWLYLPEGPQLAPVVVMGNGFYGERGMVLPDHAERFAQAGIASVVFHYRHWGDSGGLPRYVWVAEDQVQDYQSAVAFARRNPRVDGSRIAVWGTSASGGRVLSTLAREERIAPGIAQVPAIVHGGDHEDMFPEGTLRPLVRLGFKDRWRELRERERIYIRAYGTGEDLSFMPPLSPENFELLQIEDSNWPNLIAPAIRLDADEYHPERGARDIDTPTLFVLAEQDRFVNNEGTRKVAGRMPDATVASIDVGHFEFYSGESFERAVELELAFLEAHFRLE